MKRTSTELVFKWLEEVWIKGDCVLPTPLSDAFHRAYPDLADELADIHLGFESFESDGKRVTCAMVVNARHKTSGEPVKFRSRLDGKVQNGRLVATVVA